MKKVMIATFGISPGGIKAAIKQNGCEKLILIYSEKMTEEASQELRKIEELVKYFGIELVKIEVHPYSIMDNITRMKEIIKNEKGKEIILNVTGGRKTLSLAATLAGFVTNPTKIVYIQEENDQAIEIPKFTLGEKLISNEKRRILLSINKNTKFEEIQNYVKKQDIGASRYHNIMKHLRELYSLGLIEIEAGKPQSYSLTPSGELLR